MNKFDLIIFDCDGTLVNSERVYNLALIDLFQKYGLNHYTLEYADKHWLGKANDDIVKMVEDENNIELPDDMPAQFIANVPKFLADHLKIIPGAEDGIKALQEKFKTCVASNGQRANVMASLKMIGYLDLFNENEIFTVENVAKGKPEPDLFLLACQKMGATPERSIVIEDSLSGIRAGRAANMYTIGFNGVGHAEFQSEEKLLEAGADIVFSKWSDILLHIETL